MCQPTCSFLLIRITGAHCSIWCDLIRFLCRFTQDKWNNCSILQVNRFTSGVNLVGFNSIMYTMCLVFFYSNCWTRTPFTNKLPFLWIAVSKCSKEALIRKNGMKCHCIETKSTFITKQSKSPTAKAPNNCWHAKKCTCCQISASGILRLSFIIQWKFAMQISYAFQFWIAVINAQKRSNVCRVAHNQCLCN